MNLDMVVYELLSPNFKGKIYHVKVFIQFIQ